MNPFTDTDISLLDSYTDEIIGSLDGDSLNGLIEGLSDAQFDLFGGRDFLSVLTSVLNGEFKLDFTNIFTFIFSVIGSSLGSLIALLVTIISVAVVYSIIGSLKGGALSESVGKMVHFAAMAAVIAVVGGTTVSMFTVCADMLSSLSTQMNIIMPLMLTLMAGTGSTSTASVFQPSVAVISTGLFNLLGAVLMPMLIASFVFGVVNSLSGDIKFGKMSGFFNNSVKWLFGTGFFLLSAVMSVQGITASVFDGISVRSAKFTIGKYVPVIGGYLTDGFNLIVSGGIAVKNALGYTALVLLILTVLPVVLQIAVYSLCLQLAAAVIEPLGDKLMSDMLCGMGKTVGLAGGIMFGAGFLYFIFVLILLASGNVLL